MGKLEKVDAENRDKYLILEDDVYLKQLEVPAVYKVSNDSLYEVDEKALGFLQKCDGSSRLSELRPPVDFLDYILTEDIAFLSDIPRHEKKRVGKNLAPSFRYLLIESTTRCNLSCKHCYQGESRAVDLDLASFAQVAGEFEDMGGLRLIVSGGEPLLHPQFEQINLLMKDRAFRSILLTNGTLLNEKFIDNINFTEVQVSLDGVEEGHDFLRGKGSYQRTLTALQLLKEREIQISIASMVHARNCDEFPALAELVKDLGAVSWSIDVPSRAGRLVNHDQLIPPLERIMAIMQFQFGAEIHDSESNLVCGAHLACVKTDGMVTKCGLYSDWSGGHISEGLQKCWLDIPRMSLSDLDCECSYLEECKGGCRYRAECYNGKTGADPIKCLLYGID